MSYLISISYTSSDVTKTWSDPCSVLGRNMVVQYGYIRTNRLSLYVNKSLLLANKNHSQLFFIDNVQLIFFCLYAFSFNIMPVDSFWMSHIGPLIISIYNTCLLLYLALVFLPMLLWSSFLHSRFAICPGRWEVRWRRPMRWGVYSRLLVPERPGIISSSRWNNGE